MHTQYINGKLLPVTSVSKFFVTTPKSKLGVQYLREVHAPSQPMAMAASKILVASVQHNPIQSKARSVLALTRASVAVSAPISTFSQRLLASCLKERVLEMV